MLVPMPADIDYWKYVPQFICKFQALCKKTFIRSAYEHGVDVITKHQGLMAQVSSDGNYWHVIDNAAQKDIIFKSHNCLSEVLLDNTINMVVPLIFGVRKDPTTWADLVTTYAFGN